jgi:hypothetical protein
LVWQWQSYYSKTNTRIGYGRNNSRTIKTETITFEPGIFFFLFFFILFVLSL